MTDDKEPPALTPQQLKAFEVLRDAKGPKTGVVMPDGLGKPRKLGARPEAPRTFNPLTPPPSHRDVVREANDQMRPDGDRFPLEEDDDD